MSSLFKKVFPQALLDKIKKIINNFDLRLVRLVHALRSSSDIYYALNSKFSNEHQAVLKGRKAYHESLKAIGYTCALLRRNTHRIEKGLIMRPRRSVFAEGFIQETVDCYKDAMRSEQLVEDEKKWATDVLDEYFKIVGSSVVIDKARLVYNEVRKEQPEKIHLPAVFPSDDAYYKPYYYEKLPQSKISFDELKQLFVRRRSVRWYQDKHVPVQHVKAAANIASMAPSACNRQPYKFVFCNNKDKVIAIAKCAGGTVGFAENLPAIIAVIGDLSAYPFERDRHLIYIDGSLAAMQLMLALETLGLSTCPINWPEIDKNEKKLRNIINMKGYERVVMLLAVGYADTSSGIPYSQKKENDLILEDISK